MVPRFRTCRSPMFEATSASSGQAERSGAESSICAWVAYAPIEIGSESAEIRLSWAMRPRSTSFSGAARRSLRSGIRLCPPERARAAPPVPRSAASASSRVSGAA